MFGRLLRLAYQHSNTRSNHTLLVDRIETVLHLKLNRPDQRNALNYDLVCRLSEELAKFEQDSALKSVVLVGSSGNFCCGLEPSEIRSDRTLSALSRLIESFPLSKPSIAALEGYVFCVGLQLALLCDYRIVEEDAKLQLNEKLHLPLHPHLRRLHPDRDLIALFRNAPWTYGLNESFIKQLVAEHLVTKNVTMGCCFGPSLELGKCIEKFPLEAIQYDRAKLYREELYGDRVKLDDDQVKLDDRKKRNDMSDRTSLFDVLNEDVYTRAERFLKAGIGKHGASNTDTLEEIYDRWTPRLLQEEDLAN